jgi:hypothetical protein
MEQPETRPFYSELFSLIDLRCKHWAFPSQNQRLDVVIFWQGVQDQQDTQTSDGLSGFQSTD